MFRKAWLVLSSLLFSAFFAHTSDVLTLTSSTFDDEIAKHEVSLVKFYAPWCGHCKSLAPEFESAATTLKTSDPPIALIDVDCTAEKELCQNYMIQGYPTLKIFRKGEFAADYKGPREAEGIVNYMLRQAEPAALEINSLEDFKNFVNNEDYGVVAFFAPDSQLKGPFFDVANSERDNFRFAYTNNSDVLQKTGYSDNIVVYVPETLHNNFEPNEFKYEGEADAEKIKEFLLRESSGLAGIRSFAKEFLFQKIPMVSVFYDLDYSNISEAAKELRNKVLEVAKEYKDKVYFAVGNLADYSRYLEYLGFTVPDDKPVAFMLNDTARFGFDQELSVENLRQFVEDVLAGRIDPHIRSEPIPEAQDQLKIAVAKNFRELILESDKDVLIEFYAPWCGHCQKLAPDYEELANKLRGEDVVVAKMDATANDMPDEFEVYGVPTIYWLPKNTKTPALYNGSRDLDGLLNFVTKHSTDGLRDFNKAGEEFRNEL